MIAIVIKEMAVSIIQKTGSFFIKKSLLLQENTDFDRNIY